jgi:pimeloyl-ACP methyl ester carboxylesterase
LKNSTVQILVLVSNFGSLKDIKVKSEKFKGIEIGYIRQGVGEKLVLLHGFLEDSSMWGDFVAAHSDQFDMITIDLIGHGSSGCAGYVHTMEEHAEAVLSVLDKEEVKKCVMIGHSMGGYVTLAFADKFEERLVGFGLFHSTAYPDTEPKKVDRERAVAAIIDRPDLFVELTIPRLFPPSQHEEMNMQIEAAIDIAKTHPQQGVIANMRGTKDRKDRSELLKSSLLPVLFIHGNEDPVLSNQLAKKQIENCPNVTSHFIDNVGHMGHLEAPEKCFNAISSFMKKVVVNG